MKEEFQAILSQIYIAVPFSRLMDEFFELVMSNGVNVELGMHAEVLERFSRNEFEDVARKLSDRGIKTTFHAPFVDLCPASTDPDIRGVSQKRIRQVVDLIPVFKPACIVCHLGFYPELHEEIWEDFLKNSLEFWPSLIPFLEEHRTPMMLENVFENGPRELKEIIGTINSPYIRFCFDTGHTLAFSRTPWKEWMETMGAYLGQIHVHDNTGKADEHRALGSGVFPFADFFQWLMQRNVKPLITLEAHTEQWAWESLPNLARLWPWKD